MDLRATAWLAAALTSGSLLLALPPVTPARAEAPVPAAVAWPAAERASLPATLPDGTAFTPQLFLDARTSVGTAPAEDGRTLRLVLRSEPAPAVAGDSVEVRELRALPADDSPSFPAVTASGGALVWFESVRGEPLALWTAPVDPAGRARRITADTGAVRTYRSENDLVVADGQVRWTAAGAGGGTEVRSVALTGGRTQVRAQPGTWRLAGWPWLVDGVAATGGATRLRDAVTGVDRAVPVTRRAATDCSAERCRVLSIDGDGWTRIELMRPDGSDRVDVAGGDVNTEVVDVAPLGRFEVYVRLGAQAELTGNAELLVHEIATRRTVQVSPDAGSIAYRAGVLWWSTGTLDTFVRHALDLRTISP